MTYTIIGNKNTKHKSNDIQKRGFKHFKQSSFLHDLRSESAKLELHNDGNMTQALDKWIYMFIYVSNKHAPMKNIKIKPQRPPWISNDIIKLTRERNNLHKKACKEQSKTLMDAYRKIRNKINTIRTKNKRDYIKNSIKSKNPSKMWNAINTAMNKSRRNDVSSPRLSADNLNKYFSEIGSSLAQGFNSEPPKWSQNESIHTFAFHAVTEEFVINELKKLPTSHKLDILGFDSFLLNVSSATIAPAITYLINLSLCTGIMPEKLKRARVTPIFKNKGSPDLPENYRPISVVSHIGKIFEKAVCYQLTTYLQEHCFITPDQSAFLKGHSTQTALHKVVDDLLECTDEGLLSCLCFFDIRKCFDCIPHKTLLFKLSKYGIRGFEHKWFESFLSDRYQTTVYNNSSSSRTSMTMGIPQGSVLGPSLFLLFINDLTCVIKYSSINIYADDTLLYVSDDNILSATHKLQADINAVSNWFKQNQLSLSVEKTFTMFVGSKHRLEQIDTYPVLLLNDQVLQRKEEATYLGLIIDNRLTWDAHIDNLCKKLRPKVGIFSRLRHILPYDTMHMVYMAIIQSRLDYGLTIWGNAKCNKLKTVQGIQNRCARLLTGCFDHDIRGLDLLGDINILNLTQRHEYFTGLLMYKSLNGMAPNYICDTLTPMQDIHSHYTRNDHLLKIPPSRTSFGKRTFANIGSNLWNSIPKEIKICETLHDFRLKLRCYLIG